jgi:hypothetical protein
MNTVSRLLIGVASVLALTSAASATDVLRLLATVSHNQASIQDAMKKVLDARGARYTNADLTAAASDCFAKFRNRGRGTQFTCGSGSQVQFQIQVATSDLQNAENVR